MRGAARGCTARPNETPPAWQQGRSPQSPAGARRHNARVRHAHKCCARPSIITLPALGDSCHLCDMSKSEWRGVPPHQHALVSRDMLKRGVAARLRTFM